MKAEQMAFQLHEATKYRATATALSGNTLLTAPGNGTWKRLFYSIHHPDLETPNGLPVQKLRKLLSDYFMKQYFASKGFAPDVIPPGQTDGYSDNLDARIIDLAQLWITESQRDCGAIDAETGDRIFHMNKEIFRKFSTMSDLKKCFSINFISPEEVDITYERLGQSTNYTGVKVIQITTKDDTDQNVDELNKVFKADKLSFEKPVQEKDANQKLLDTRPNVKFSQPLKFKLDPENYVIVENRKSAPTVFDCATQFNKKHAYRESDGSNKTMSLFCAIWGMEPDEIVTPDGGTKIKNCYGKEQAGWTSWVSGAWKTKEQMWQFAGFKVSYHPFNWSKEKDEASVALLLKCLVNAPSDDPELDAGHCLMADFSSAWSFKYQLGNGSHLFESGTSDEKSTYWILDQIRSSDKNEMLNFIRFTGDLALSRPYCSLIRAYRKSTEGMDGCSDNNAAANQSAPSTIVASSGTSPAAHAYDAQEKIEEARSKMNNYKYFKLSFVTEHVGLSPYTKELAIAFKEEIRKSLKLGEEMAKNIIVEIEE